METNERNRISPNTSRRSAGSTRTAKGTKIKLLTESGTNQFFGKPENDRKPQPRSRSKRARKNFRPSFANFSVNTLSAIPVSSTILSHKDKLAVAKSLSKLIPHSLMSKGNFNLTDTIDDVLTYLIKLAQTLPLTNAYVDLDNHKLLDYIPQESHSFSGYILQFPVNSFYTEKVLKDKKFHNLLVSYMKFTLEFLGFNTFYDYDVEATIEHLHEEIYELQYQAENDEENEAEDIPTQIENLQEAIDLFNDKIEPFCQAVYRKKVNPKKLKKSLMTYSATNKNRKKLITWMLEGISLYEESISLNNYICSEALREEYFTNGEVDPSLYIKFVWGNEYVSDRCFEDLDMTMMEVGYVPLIVTCEIDTLKDKKSLENKITAEEKKLKKLMNWWIKGTDKISNLKF